jgi:hypothetical protein
MQFEFFFKVSILILLTIIAISCIFIALYLSEVPQISDHLFGLNNLLINSGNN